MKQIPHRLLLIGLTDESVLVENLKSAGYLTTVLTTSHIPASVNYSLVDLTVIDGSVRSYVYLCQKIRQLSNAPILVFLSPHELTILSSSTVDVIDRFLLKPLDIPEVLAHVQSLLRRSDWQKTIINSCETENQHCIGAGL